MSKRFREAFKDTICKCRRKRSLAFRPPNSTTYTQAYYTCCKPERLQTRGLTPRPQHSNGNHVMRSDTLQTQVSFTLNGNANSDADDMVKERLLEETGDVGT